MALDLESLQDVGTDRWNREWQRAYVELGYVAVSVARRFLGRRFPQHVELVAGDALIKLSETGIHRCRTVEDIVLLLRKIAFQAVVDFLRRRSVRPEGHVQENVDAAEFAAAEGEDNFERLKDEIAERQHLEGFDEERLIRLFVQEFRLTPLEEALLREHIINHCTQQEFADKWVLSVKGIGGRKGRLLTRLGAFGVILPVIARRNW